MTQFTSDQKDLIRIFRSLEKELGHIPTLLDLEDAGVTRSKIRQSFGSLNRMVSELSPESPSTSAFPDDYVHRRTQKRYVITSVQNNVPLNRNFVKSLRHYCHHYSADLIVIPMYYKLYSGVPVWPSELNGHYLSRQLSLNDNLEVRGDVFIAATAKNPLAGLDNISRQKSAIFGHSQLQMKMIATPKKELPKMLHTTGSLSEKAYSKTRAGIIGDFHHSHSALIVEIDGDTFHVRQLNADDKGCFHDLDLKVTPRGIKSGVRVSAVVFGDIHARFLDPNVKAATWTNKDSIIKTLNPEHEVLHDVIDFYSRNHHHKGNTFLNYLKHHKKTDSVAQEIQELGEIHNELWSRKDTRYHYISSNHHDAITRWLNEADPRQDPENAHFYHSLMAQMLGSTDIVGHAPDPLQLCLRLLIKNYKDTHFWGRDERFILHGIDLTNHGDKGSNGARGSAASFAKAGYKTVTGHTHTPQIEKGAYVVGCSCVLDMEYNTGYSSWLHTHCVIYPNGKRALINIINGKWRLK